MRKTALGKYRVHRIENSPLPTERSDGERAVLLLGFPFSSLRFVQQTVHVGVLPQGVPIFVLFEKDIFSEKGLPFKMQAFQQAPGTHISGIALGKYPVNAGRKALFDHSGDGFGCISVPLEIFIYDVPQLLCLKIPASKVHIANDLPGAFQLDGDELIVVNPVCQVSPPVFVGDAGVCLEIVVLSLGQEFVDIVIIALFKISQDQPVCFDCFHHSLPLLVSFVFISRPSAPADAEQAVGLNFLHMGRKVGSLCIKHNTVNSTCSVRIIPHRIP